MITIHHTHFDWENQTGAPVWPISCYPEDGHPHLSSVRAMLHESSVCFALHVRFGNLVMGEARAALLLGVISEAATKLGCEHIDQDEPGRYRLVLGPLDASSRRKREILVVQKWRELWIACGNSPDLDPPVPRVSLERSYRLPGAADPRIFTEGQYLLRATRPGIGSATPVVS